MTISSLEWCRGARDVTWLCDQDPRGIDLAAPAGHVLVLEDRTGFITIEDGADAAIWNADGSRRCKVRHPLPEEAGRFAFYYSEYVSGRLHAILAGVGGDFGVYIDEITGATFGLHEAR